MLRRRHETLQEQALREARAAGGIGGPAPVAGPSMRIRSTRASVGLVVAGVWLVLGGAFTLWGVWDYIHTELRTVTVTRVAAIPTVGEDDCDFSALAGEPAGRWSGDCPPGAVVGQEVELFINPDGMVWDSPGSMAAMIAVAAAVTVLGALALFGLAWHLNRPRTTAQGAKGQAGWLPDPSGQPTMRYWDGRAWTDWDLEGWTEQNRANPAPPPPVSAGSVLGAARPPGPRPSKWAPVGDALLVVGWVWVLLWGALTLWFLFGSPVDTAAPDAGLWIGIIAVLGALPLIGLGCLLARPSVAKLAKSFLSTLLVIAFLFLWAWAGTIWPWLIPEGY